MYIKKIVIEKNGKSTEIFKFNKRLSVVRDSVELYDIIKLLLGLREAARSFCDIKFFAEIELDKIYYISGSKNKGEHLFKVSVGCDDTADCTEEYFETIKQNEEMDSSLFFHKFKRQNFPHRLVRYKDILKYYPNGNFATITNGYGTTRSFRGFMVQYIKHFKPLRLRKDKNLFLKLLSNGEFQVGTLNSDEKFFLSESENTIYHFLSFISIADFWDRAEKIRNMNGVKKPLIVSGFLEHIDSSVDITDILSKTKALARQTILFVSKEMPVVKYNIQGDFNEREEGKNAMCHTSMGAYTRNGGNSR